METLNFADFVGCGEAPVLIQRLYEALQRDEAVMLDFARASPADLDWVQVVLGPLHLDFTAEQLRRCIKADFSQAEEGAKERFVQEVRAIPGLFRLAHAAGAALVFLRPDSVEVLHAGRAGVDGGPVPLLRLRTPALETHRVEPLFAS